MLSRVPGDGLAGVFDRFDLVNRETVVAAVSGGGDSTALLLLLQDHIRRRGLPTRILAITVDHRLRPESAAEARTVTAFCAARGMEHRILSWEGEKPATGLSAAARTARYDLLHSAAQAAETDIVFTGHTLDDQIETVAMRRARGTGRGLAGMAIATLYAGRSWILRPLLETGRETLRDYLRLKGVAWIEDPSNENLRYERVRTRHMLARPDSAYTDVTLEGIRLAQAERAALAEKAAGLVERHLSRPAPGLYRIEREFFDGADSDAALYAFRILLATVGGVGHLPENSGTAALLAEVRSGSVRATLSRTLVDARKGHVFLCRERRGLPDAGPVSDGTIWDGRFRLKVPNAVREKVLIAPGVTMTKDRMSGYDAPARLVATALAAAPVVRPRRSIDQKVVGSGAAVGIVPVVAPFLDFLPSFDIAPAKALAELIGSGTVPAPPLAGP